MGVHIRKPTGRPRLMQVTSRSLVRVPVPPGPEGPARLLPALADALAGDGPAIAPVPVVSATVSSDYVATALRAVQADGGPPLESDDVAAVVATSGSTGDPRGVLLTADNLTALTPAVQAQARPQWIVALPVTSIGGINVLVRALAADLEPLVVPSIGGAGPFRPEEFTSIVDRARERSDDVRVSLVPAQLTRLLSDTAATEALQACHSVLVGGAGLRPSLRSVAENLGIDLTSTYGATETSGGCVYDGRPLDGVTITVDEPTGRLRLSGPSIAIGYRGDPAATAATFIDGAYLSSDVGTVSDDGTVTVIGRADDVVTVGGVNVSPGAAERVITDHPDVAAGAVVAAIDANGDARLHAFVEIRDDASGVADSVRAAVTEQLGRPARPVVHRVQHLPHLPNGKVDRRALVQWAAENPLDT